MSQTPKVNDNALMCVHFEKQYHFTPVKVLGVYYSPNYAYEVTVIDGQGRKFEGVAPHALLTLPRDVEASDIIDLRMGHAAARCTYRIAQNPFIRFSYVFSEEEENLLRMGDWRQWLPKKLAQRFGFGDVLIDTI